MRWCGALFVLVACGGGSNPLIGQDDAKALVAKWQGAWVMPYMTSDTGPYVVYDIKDETYVEWDGDRSTTGNFRIIAPCLVELSHGKTRRYKQFAFATNGQLVIETPLGAKRGDTWYVCSFEKEVVVYAPDSCRVYGRAIRRPERDEPEPATCHTDGDHVTIDVDGRVIDLKIWGDVLVRMTDEPKLGPFHAASLDDARKRADEKRLGP